MVSTVLTDIEGTTTSLSFVKDVLFPHSRERIREFIHSNAQKAEVQEAIREVASVARISLELDAICDQLLTWIDEDKKIKPLKTLQGLIWERGYQQRDFYGHIYEDAYTRLCEWRAQGLRLGIFSSGSCKAQQLLFAHTPFGDLTPLFDFYFDTGVGMKQSPEAYLKIAQEMGTECSSILFLSDIEAELNAASSVGYRTTLLQRDTDQSTNTSHHAVARSFLEITP